jgi:predicted dehydrogenase
MKPQPFPTAGTHLARHRPKLGFLGTGRIGRNRLEAIVRSDLADIAFIADPDGSMAEQACLLAPGSERLDGLEHLLETDIDGLVIATPSALHAQQSIRALEAGLAVFCQKPLGRNRREVTDVVAAARSADRLLGVDLSYRFTTGAQMIAERIGRGDIGRIFSADLEFHNAYGPDRPWFYDRNLSGGGCLIDLGVHLVDLAQWLLRPAGMHVVEAALYREGRRLRSSSEEVEDFAAATLETADGVTIRLACSWRLHAGCDAVIRARFFGERGGLEFCNIGGSFYDFSARHHVATASNALCDPPDDWSGRAAVDWLRRLADSPAYDPACEQFISSAEALDNIYQAGLREEQSL